MNSTSRPSVPQEMIEEIRTRSDIIAVISECGVVLRPAGQDYKGLCPFHDEKTPSFTVSPQKQMFYCFGCQTGGNIFTFLQKHEGKEFWEALAWLADRLNIALPTQSVRKSNAQRRIASLEDLNRFAVEYYHRELLTEHVGTAAMHYLKQRGVQPKTVRAFQLGFARSGRRVFTEAAVEKGFSIQQLIDAGLAKEGDRGVQDRFWNRTLFPIHNDRGVPVGFGGRSLSEEHQPKYLNSPATVLYDKSNILYNLDKARPAIYKKQQALLVEGYMDVLMLFQAGIENVVAASGTSLSENHANLLKRFTPEVIIVFDGDASGFQAAQRGLHRLLAAGLRVSVALLPKGEDPDSFVRNYGPVRFTNLVAKAINLVEFQIQAAVRQQDSHRVDVKMALAKEIAQTILPVENRTEQAEYVKYTARELQLREETLWTEIKAAKAEAKRNETKKLEEEKTADYKVSGKPPPHRGKPKKDAGLITPRVRVEQQLMEALVQTPSLILMIKERLEIEDFYEYFTVSGFVKLAGLLWEASEEDGNVDVQTLVQECENEKLRAFMSKALCLRTPPDTLQEARVDGCLKKLKQYLLQDFEQRIRSLALAEGADEMETLEELVELSNRRRALQATRGENRNEGGS